MLNLFILLIYLGAGYCFKDNLILLLGLWLFITANNLENAVRRKELNKKDKL